MNPSKIKYFFLFFFAFFLQLKINAQNSSYDQLKLDYDRLRKEEKQDSALVTAKQMNAWTLKIESDTSLRYALSLSFIGQSFYDKEEFDSSKFFLVKSINCFELQNKRRSIEYTETLNNLGLTLQNLGEYKSAEKNFIQAIEIRDKYPTGKGHKPKYQNNLGSLYVSMGFYDEAENVILKSIKRLEELYASDSSKYISSIKDLAVVHFEKDDYQTANYYFRKWFHYAFADIHSQQNLVSGMTDYILNDISLKDFSHATMLLSKADSILLATKKSHFSKQNGEMKFAHAKYEYAKGNFALAETNFSETVKFFETYNFLYDKEYSAALLGMSSLKLKQDDIESALLYSNKALQNRREILGEHHPLYAVSLRQNAKILSSFNRYKEAVSMLLQAVEIMEPIVGEHSKVITEIRLLLAINYRKLGLLRDAEIFAVKVLEYYVEEGNKMGESLALNNLGFLYIDDDKLELAKQLISKSLQLRLEIEKSDTSKYFSVLHSMAKVNFALGMYDEAEHFYLQWWAYIKKQPNLTESKTNGLMDIAENYMRKSNYVEAEKFLHFADSILANHPAFVNSASRAYVQKVFGDLSLQKDQYDHALAFYNDSKKRLNHLDLVESKEFSDVMKGLSIYYLKDKAKDLNMSLKFIKEAAKIQLQILGDQHAEYAKTLDVMGVIYVDLALYDSALYCYNRALKIKRVSLGDHHPSYASTLNNIGVLYSRMGAMDRVLPYYEESLNIKLSTFKEPHRDVATAYNNLAVVYKKLGDFQKAEDYYFKALEIRKIVFDSDNPGIASIYENLGSLYLELGDYKTAEIQYQKASEIWEKRQDNSSVDYASFLLGQASLFSHLKKKDEAVSNILQSLKIYESIKGYGKNHPKYAIALNDLGRCYLSMKKYIEADSCFSKSLKTRLKLTNKNFNEIARSYRNLGELAYYQSDFPKAEGLFLSALAISDSVRGKESPLSSSINIELARNYFKSKNYESFLNLSEDIFKIKLKELGNNFEWLNEYQREFYWKKESAFFEYLSEVANSGYAINPDFAGLNYNAVLILKGQMLEAKMASEGYFGEVDRLREEISLKRKLMVKMESDGIGSRKMIDQLHLEADSLDKVLSNVLPGYAEQRRNLSIRWEDIQHSLDIGEVAIEFVRFYNSEDSSYYYNALLIKRGEKNPQLVQLCEEKKLKELVNYVNLNSYYDLIWKPIEPYLKEVHSIYYSPVGELNNIPFHALFTNDSLSSSMNKNRSAKRGVKLEAENNLDGISCNENTSFLMDKFTLHQLTSTRYLAMGIKEKAAQKISTTIGIVGAVDYDFLLNSDEKNRKIKGRVNGNRSSKSFSNRLPYLEGTKLESDSLKFVVGNANWKVECFSGGSASEDNISRLESKHAKGVLHIATHGYAFSNFNFTDTTDRSSLRYSYRYSTNPMVRSGLILAGGNWAWTGSDTLSKLGAEQNGIFTALEVSQLDLRNTKLVVLSACETGLGKIEGSEGTFGLKRGFKLAGVEQIIVSLWSVPDKETMELMTLFYKDLTKTFNPIVSFAKAQKEMRKKYPTEPEKWAGFVLVR